MSLPQRSAPSRLGAPVAGDVRARLSWPEKIARALAVVACVWFALAAAWGMFGIIGSGHFAAMSGTGIMGENIVNWRIWGPVWRYTFEKPLPAEYFCHHPLGPFWVSAFFFWVFGHHDFILSMPAVLMSAATPPLLYGIGKRKWGIIPGAAAACGFVVLPITLGFAHFHNLEVAVMFGCILFFWGQVRYLEDPKKRFLLASLAGALFATSSDWPGYVAIGVLLGWGLMRAYVLPARLFEKIKLAPYARWWALSAALCVATLLLWVVLFSKANKIGDWLGSAEMRGGGEPGLPLKAALQARRYWIEVMFTPLAILLGKIMLPICVLRLIVYRRDVEIFSLAMLMAALVQYVGFKRGADVHIFWPHYFGAYYALALGQLIATLLSVSRWILARFPLARARAPAIAQSFALVMVFAPTILVLPDGMRGLRMGRQTGGRFNNNGTIIRSDQDVLFIVDQLVPLLPYHAIVDVNQSVGWGWEHSWVLDTVSEWQSTPRQPLGPGNEMHPFWIARASGHNAAQLKAAVAAEHVRFYDDVMVVDEREPASPLDAYSLSIREPNPLEWYFKSGVERVRTMGKTPDPFLTWEWRVHLDQAADVPTAEPQSLSELRIAYNVAVTQNDDAKREKLREKIDAQIDRRVACRYDQGIFMVGVRIVQGVEPRLEVWFEADEGPTTGEATFSIHSVVEARDPLSLLPPDATERDMAYPPPLTPRLWKKGFLYAIETPLFHRTGLEKYWGFWTSRDGQAAPRRVDNEPFTVLTILK